MSGTMNTNDELKQQLWDMAYGLLDPEAEAALRTQIKSDPAIARLYAEVRLQADLVASAARVQDSSLNISAGPAAVSKEAVSKEDRRTRPKPGSKVSTRASTHAPLAKSGSVTNWLAVAGTTALLLLLAYGLYQPSVLTPIAMNTGAPSEVFFTKIQTTAPLTEGLTGAIEIETRDQRDHARQAQLDVRLVDAAGLEVFSKKVSTAADGRSTVELPGAALKKGVRLQVLPVDATAKSEAEETLAISTELPLVEEQKRTFTLLEKPYAEPGEQVGFVQIRVGQFSKESQAPPADGLIAADKSGTRDAASQWTTDPATGVVQGQFKQQAGSLNSLMMRRREAASSQPMEKQFGGGEGGGLPQGALAQGGPLAKGNADAKSENQEQEADRSSNFRGGKVGANTLAENAAKADAAQAGPAGSPAAAPNRGANTVRKAGDGEQKMSRMMAPSPAIAPGSTPGGIAPIERAKADDERRSPNGTAPFSSPPAPAPAMMPAPQPKAAAVPGSAPPPLTPAAPAPLRDEKGADSATVEKPAPTGRAKEQENVANLNGANRALPGEVRPEDRPGLPMQAKKSAGYAAIAANDPQQPAKPAIVKSLKEIAETNELQIPEQLGDEALIVVARQGAAVIARQELSVRELAERKAFVLPPEVEGTVNVDFYRQTDANTPILRKEVQRPSARGLQIAIEGLKRRYAPNERVQLKLQVTDESGRPAPASLGVRVWEEEAVKLAQEPLLLADSFARGEVAASSMAENHALAFGGQLQNSQEEWRDLQRKQMAEIKPGEGAAIPAGPEIDQLSRFDHQPSQGESVPATIVLADNRAEVIDELRRNVAVDQTKEGERAAPMQSLGRVFIYSSLALLLLIGLMFAARRPVQPLVWVPAVGVSLLMLVMGIARFTPSGAPEAMQIAQVDRVRERASSTASEATPASPPTAEEAMSLKDAAPALEGELLQRRNSDPAPASPGNGEATNGAVATRQEMKRNVFGSEPEKLAETSPQSAQLRSGEDRPAPENAADKSGARSLGAPAPKPGNLAMAAAAPVDGHALTEQAKGENSLPSSLFWRPLSPTDAGGTVTIEFTMPAVPSEYRLLIDAIGSGRLGGEQRLIICSEPARE